MLKTDYQIVLASNSPRRKELLAGLDVPFTVKVVEGIDESYPADLSVMDIAQYIATKKAAAYQGEISDNELVITADTIVVLGGDVLGKPKTFDEAKQMLYALSGKTHHVSTGVCLTTKERQKSFSVVTDVTFKKLTDSEIDYYVEHYKPLDKAGAYGIQEWIGHIGVSHINGSYFNVMGLPVQRIYQEMQDL